MTFLLVTVVVTIIQVSLLFFANVLYIFNGLFIVALVMMFFFTDGKMGGVVKSLFSGQSFQKMAFATDIGAAILKQTHWHRNLLEVNEHMMSTLKEINKAGKK